MRLKRLNAGVRVCALLSFVVLVALAFTAASALALTNPERHYEQVSPAYKGGYAAGKVLGVAQDGESVEYYSAGSFAGIAGAASTGTILTGIDYLARRGSSEWSTVSTVAPASLIAAPAGEGGDMSPSLDEVLVIGAPGPHSENPLEQYDFLFHSTGLPNTDADWELGGTLAPLTPKGPVRASYVSSSLGFCQMLMQASTGEPFVPEATGRAPQLYDVNRGCNGEAKTVKLVGLNNAGKLISPACYSEIGGGSYGPPAFGRSAFNAINTDGNEVFFTTCTNNIGQTPGYEVPHQVYVRLAGSTTLEVSRPLGSCVGEASPHVAGEVPCQNAATRASADFAGASEDGSRVYFTAPLASKQPSLVPDDEDASNNLYMASIGCAPSKPSCGAAEREVTGLQEVSHDPVGGEAAEVQGVVRVAPDGSRTYFVARGVLSNGAGPDGRVALSGADNLYVYDAGSNTTAFIGELCSGTDLSGSVEDGSCPSGESDEKLWTNNESQAQTGGTDGRFLVFGTFAQLLPSDSNAAQDVYRYDAETGRLTRVSGGEDGADDNGNRTVFGKQGEILGAKIPLGHYGGKLSQQHESDNRAISEDGSRIVFASAEPLSPQATNGLENAYEWHEAPGGVGEGSVSLISGGSAEEPVGYDQVVISPSGRDIFFLTSQGLLPQDTDGEADVYDARLGEGFATPAAPVAPCSGDACQGSLTNPAPLLVPGSVTQAPGENLLPPSPTAVKPKPKARSKKCAKAKKLSHRKCIKSKHAKKTSRRNK
jgi:hypothetical protein